MDDYQEVLDDDLKLENQQIVFDPASNINLFNTVSNDPKDIGKDMDFLEVQNEDHFEYDSNLSNAFSTTNGDLGHKKDLMAGIVLLSFIVLLFFLYSFFVYLECQKYKVLLSTSKPRHRSR